MNETLNEKAKAAFRRFSPFIRDYIYRKGWNTLRTVQIEAADLIFNTETNLLISSDTASGKTEAAMFPLLSMMEQESPDYFQVLYISPLKSLINDQYERMSELLQESGMPVFRWHGDVNQSKKQAWLKEPKGLIQITPESLESILCRRSNDIPRLFANLKFVIIDEVHALMGSDRGNQIICQLQRIARLISYDPRRIALSATIGDKQKAEKWLSGGSDRAVKTIQIPSDNTVWKLALEHFYITDPSATKGVDPATDFIYEATKKDKCVVFSNSREETEDICASLRSVGKKKGELDRFYIHHGNLSASIREEAEEVMKQEERAITACATATLELGIDIGKLRRIINQEAPTSVSAFLQRLGRSGRRGLPPEMLMIFRSEEPLPNAPIPQLIPWSLLQGIAIVELYRKEKWIEPSGEKPLPLSLLFHQTLSTLAAAGSLKAAALAERVLTLAPFSKVSKEDYKQILIHLIQNDYMQLTEEKELIVGLRGEKILQSFKFFAVFKDSDDFTVRSGSEEIGTITASPPVGEHFALAGRVWEVEEIDAVRRLVFCKKVDGKMKVSWPGEGGIIHTRILQKMKEVLCSTEEYPYLLEGARKRLAEARRSAQNTGLIQRNILPLGGNSYAYFPWLGTRGFQALKRIIKYSKASTKLYDIQSGGCYFITFKSDEKAISEIKNSLKDLGQSLPENPKLVPETEYPAFDKYDACLPREKLVLAYMENRLDLKEAKEALLML